MKRSKSPTKALQKNTIPSIISKKAGSSIKSPKAITFEQIKQMLKQNPYNVPPDDQLLKIKEKQQEQERLRQMEMAHQSLVARNVQGLPTLSEKTIEKKENQQIAGERQRRQDMHGFVNQTRDILIAQIKIDRKRNEIQRINQQQKTEKAIIENETSNLEVTRNQYEMTANGIKAQLQRAKTEMERALVEKAEIQRQLKMKRESVARIKSEITKNEDSVFAARNYKQFLESMTPEGEQPFEHFNKESVLTSDIEHLEEENLFLIKKCTEMETEKERGIQVMESNLAKATQEKDKMEEASNRVSLVDPIECDTTQLMKNTETIEEERVRLAKIVENAFIKCFSMKTDMNPVMMLERIENGLELLYKKQSEISESFVQEQQTLIDKQRREEARIARQQQKIKEQKKKMEAALERAQRPIKAKVGRPTRERVLPVTFQRKEDSGKIQDEKLQEEFLFGPIQF